MKARMSCGAGSPAGPSLSWTLARGVGGGDSLCVVTSSCRVSSAGEASCFLSFQGLCRIAELEPDYCVGLHRGLGEQAAQAGDTGQPQGGCRLLQAEPHRAQPDGVGPRPHSTPPPCGSLPLHTWLTTGPGGHRAVSSLCFVLGGGAGRLGRDLALRGRSLPAWDYHPFPALQSRPAAQKPHPNGKWVGGGSSGVCWGWWVDAELGAGSSADPAAPGASA